MLLARCARDARSDQKADAPSGVSYGQPNGLSRIVPKRHASGRSDSFPRPSTDAMYSPDRSIVDKSGHRSYEARINCFVSRRRGDLKEEVHMFQPRVLISFICAAVFVLCVAPMLGQPA